MLNIEIRRLDDDTLAPVSIASLAMEVRGEFRYPREVEKALGKAGGNGAGSTGPALIIRCADQQDVMRCLDFASRRGLLIAMHNGRNDRAAWDDCDQGIAVDLSPLNEAQR